jgi:SAM-dependent methyltransferase
MDVLGNALLDYYNGTYSQDIQTYSDLGGWDELPLDYLFRSYDQMPAIEQKALELCRGSVLDIGCGAGIHSLYLQSKAIAVTALDHSKGAIEVCKAKGISSFELADINTFRTTVKYDTLLLLMNGIGLAGSLTNLAGFLTHLKTFMKEDGQLILDSSDVIYMFDQDDDGGYWIDASQGYYGETNFKMRYKDQESESFPWLYIDFESLKEIASDCGFNVELILKGDHYDYLAGLSLKPHLI